MRDVQPKEDESMNLTEEDYLMAVLLGTATYTTWTGVDIDDNAIITTTVQTYAEWVIDENYRAEVINRFGKL